MTAAALTAFGALAMMGGVTPMLPLLAAGLLATYQFDARIEPPDWWVHWTLRLALYAAIGFLNANRLNERLVDSFLLAPAMDTLGQWMAAELVIQAWRRRPAGGPRAASAILLSGLTLAAACQTSNEQSPRLFVAAYMLFLLLSLARWRRGAATLRAAAIALALAAGAAAYGAVWTNRMALTAWGAQNLEGRPAPEMAGLSQEPTLGETFGLRGSARRVLRIEGLNGPTYLRGIAFDTYRGGRWGPRLDLRAFRPVALLGANAAGSRARVTPLASTDGLLLASLNSAGVDVGDNDEALWAPALGGPLRVQTSRPSPYTISQATDEAHQGPLAAPPTPETRVRCLSVPADVDPRVRALAQEIAGGERDPRRRIAAVQNYLIAHHRYSLTFHPGPGDPLSAFLLRTPPPAAHCEYFAASAAILLRCLGVPTRYVIGYYAHESDGPGVTVVRQRDAHAWAEAWVAGTGWVTVDATPGDGRPGGDSDSVPPMQRVAEWLADRAVEFRAWLLSRDWPRLALRLSGAAFLLLGTRALWHRLRRPHPPPILAEQDYTVPDADLAGLAARFEALLARQGWPCPPGRPWQEHLATLDTPPEPPHPPAPSPSEGARGRKNQTLSPTRERVASLSEPGEGDEPGRRNETSEAAQAFVRAYNRVRFGRAAGAEAARLPALLAEAERHFEHTKEQG